MLYNNKLWKEKVFQLYSLPSLFPYIYFSNSNSIKWTSRLFVHLFVSCRFVSSSHPLIVSTVIYLIKLFFCAFFSLSPFIILWRVFAVLLPFVHLSCALRYYYYCSSYRCSFLLFHIVFDRSPLKFDIVFIFLFQW